MIYKWLFERVVDTGFMPQMCWAGANKSALLWLPGNTFKGAEFVRWAVGKAQFVGCTQLGFKSYTQAQQTQAGIVAWVGLDIDELPIDDQKLIGICQQFNGSLRSSCGGSGRHMLFRLANPITCTYQQANSIVKLLTKPIVEAVNAAGMTVCKADKRAFYLEGGKNEWIHRMEGFYENQITAAADQVDTTGERDGQVEAGGGRSAGVEQWLGQFRRAGLINRVGSRNPLNISRIVRFLRMAGESVHTVSPLTSTTGTNGYLDVGPDWISLWAWADGAPIWRWDE